MPEYPVRKNPKKIIAATAVVVVVLVATYGIVTWWKPTFVVYTYSGFMDWGDEGASAVLKRAFAPFEKKYGINIQFIDLQGDTSFLVSRLNAEKSNPVADVVIGLDNIIVLQENARSVLEPYISPSLKYINQSLVDTLDPDHYLTPFDFGLVTLIYSMNKINETSYPQIGNLTFADLASNELASSLVTEDPRFSSPGLAFFLSEIAVYKKLLNEDWTSWWNDVEGKIDVEQGWSQAWSTWSTSPTRNLLVSYGTDPAYSASYTNSTPDIAVAPLYYEGKPWAWMQVEGVGLVKNGPHPDLGKAFIDYCLNITVQQEIPLNQWMFPVRTDLTLPNVFQYAIHPDEISILNSLLNSTEIRTNIQSWLDEYTAVMTPG